MQRGHDVAIVGGGHNGLVAAAYLAGAGKSVVVLERRAVVGGTVGTAEFAPGFRAPVGFPTAELLHPSIVEDLALGRHGLKLLSGRVGTFLPLANGEPLLLTGRGDGAAVRPSLSSGDAESLAAFQGFVERVGAVLESVFTAPLPQVELRGIGDIVDLFKLGWRLRRLGREEAREAMRYLPMAIQDVLDERFAGDALKAAIAWPALTASWLGPRSPGSAYGLLHHRPAWCSALFTPPVFAQGGPGALASALASAASAAGAHIRTEASVTRIAVNRDGVNGVVLEDGEEIPARVVVTAADLRHSLLELIDPVWLDPEFTTMVRNVRGRGTVAFVHLALETLPRFRLAPEGGDHLTGRIQIGPSLDYLERAFDGVKYGRVPAELCLECTIPSLTDPTIAPHGKHLMVVWVQFVPHDLRSGTWEDEREKLGDRVVSLIESYAPGFMSSVLRRAVTTPVDIGQRFGLTQGCLYHAELALDQLFYMRPVPGWYRYRTPIERFYLCGAGAHPGGGVTGLPGKNAARQVLDDWKKG